MLRRHFPCVAVLLKRYQNLSLEINIDTHFFMWAYLILFWKVPICSAHQSERVNGSSTASIAASRLILSLGEMFCFFFFRINVQTKTLLALDMVKIKREKIFLTELNISESKMKRFWIKYLLLINQRENANDSNLKLVDNILGD